MSGIFRQRRLKGRKSDAGITVQGMRTPAPIESSYVLTMEFQTNHQISFGEVKDYDLAYALLEQMPVGSVLDVLRCELVPAPVRPEAGA